MKSGEKNSELTKLVKLSLKKNYGNLCPIWRRKKEHLVNEEWLNHWKTTNDCKTIVNLWNHFQEKNIKGRQFSPIERESVSRYNGHISIEIMKSRTSVLFQMKPWIGQVKIQPIKWM